MELLFYADPPREIYTVFKNGLPTYKCTYDMKLEKKTITDLHDGLLAFGIYPRPFSSFFLKNNKYQIHFTETIIEVTIKGLFNPHTIAIYKGCEYIAVSHWGNKVSLFKNQTQIGYFIKSQKINNEEKWEMKIVLNKNENDIFILLFCFHTYSNFLKEDPDGSNPSFALNFNKRFNKNWVPEE